ncbi:hypothetical protein [Actinomadura madurae]|nr:hypothetical protein [Actinomadura madurae]MCP9953861.1 hypothetical protein [Actinomadura madurae]MCQ0019328.1 hypothetical protein [Actinomadura madurae]
MPGHDGLRVLGEPSRTAPLGPHGIRAVMLTTVRAAASGDVALSPSVTPPRHRRLRRPPPLPAPRPGRPDPSPREQDVMALHTRGQAAAFSHRVTL